MDNNSNPELNSIFNQAIKTGGGFTLPPEAAAQLRQHVASNPDNPLPNMNMSMDDYDQKISKEMHNHISYQIFSDEVKKIQKDTSDKLSENTHPHRSIFENVMEENKSMNPNLNSENRNFEEYKDAVNNKKVSYLELEYDRTSILKTIEMIDTYRAKVKYINDLKDAGDAAKKVMEVNAQIEMDLSLDINEIESYRDYLVQVVNEVINPKLVEYRADKSTHNLSTLCESMIYTLTEKIELLKGDASNEALATKNKAITVVDYYLHLMNDKNVWLPLVDKFDVYAQTNNKQIYKGLNALKEDLKMGRTPKLFKEFGSIASDIVESGFKTLQEAFMITTKNEAAAYLYSYIVLLFIHKKYSSNKIANITGAKLFMITLDSYQSGNYDITDPELLLKRIADEYTYKISLVENSMMDRIINNIYTYLRKLFNITFP